METSTYDVSLFASANRPQWWMRIYDSLKSNKCKWEIVFVGDVEPKFKLPENFRWYYCSAKPSQCYAAASYFTKGRLIGYCADDATYHEKALDWIVSAHTRLGKKTILTQLTIENGKDVTDEHYFFRNCPDTPQMAPMAFYNREWFWELGGLDRNFCAGQYENDLVMRAYQDGGKVRLVPTSKVYLNHEECHGGLINKIKYRLGKNSFRSGYQIDRRYLEECWLDCGYGTYNENTLTHGIISKERLLPLHPYNYKNILTIPQGIQGRWEGR